MDIDFFAALGLLGTVLYTAAFALLQAGRLNATHCRYSLLNAAAAVLLLISLSQTFHLASVLSNLIWLSLSLAGLYRAARTPGGRDAASLSPEAR